MAIRDILVGIDATSAGESRLRLALRLARDHRAYLAAAYCMPELSAPAVSASTGIPVNPSPGLIVVPQVLVARSDTALDALPQISHEAQHAEQIEHLFRNELQEEGLEGEWHLFSLGQIAAFIDLAKSFDLTALGQLPPETQPSGFPPSEIVMASGRPVLVIPYAGAFDGIGRRALIAWDGTREAIRAVHGALPLLDRAEAVMLVYVGVQQADVEQYRPSIERISGHLQRHGVAVKPEETRRGDLQYPRFYCRVLPISRPT
jgi:nucleotide-binding universal stress UspA family protein